MKCDDFLSALETGGFIRRLRARRHAARCPECAAAQARLAEIKSEMAAAEPLTPRQRQLWTQAARAASHASSAWPWRVIATGVAAACVLLATTLWFLRRPPAGKRGPADEIRIVQIDPGEELTRLALDVERLDAELNKLQQQVERRDAQRQVAVVLDRFGRW